jgi:hypothetical protein
MGFVIGDRGRQGARSGLVPGALGRSGNAPRHDPGAKTAIRDFVKMAWLDPRTRSPSTAALTE